MTRSTKAATPKTLKDFFWRNGYVRWQDPSRVKEGTQSYKKGDEVRLVANSQRELREIRRLLKAKGFKPGRAWKQGSQYRQPIYGREEVERFLDMVGWFDE